MTTDSTTHIFFHMLAEAEEWYTFLMHKILTGCKDISGFHSALQMIGYAQNSMECLIKYFGVSNLKDI